jgi:hypothetical protein
LFNDGCKLISLDDCCCNLVSLYDDNDNTDDGGLSQSKLRSLTLVHQDKKGKFIDWWVLQNQKVDRNAKAFLRKCKLNKRPHRPVRLLYEKWALYIQGVKQSKINKNSLHASLLAP